MVNKYVHNTSVKRSEEGVRRERHSGHHEPPPYSNEPPQYSNEPPPYSNEPPQYRIEPTCQTVGSSTIENTSLCYREHKPLLYSC